MAYLMQDRMTKFKFRLGLAVSVLTLGLAGATSAHAAPVFADWVNGSIDGIGITVTDVGGPATPGEITNVTASFSDPTFTAAYATNFSALKFGALGIPGNLLADISFTEALPTGSFLFAIDMDFSGETFVISSDLGFLSLTGQGETQTGATSQLPTYNHTNGNLVSAFSSGGANFDEYSLFDVSGVSSLSVQWLNGGAASGSLIAIGTPGDPGMSPVPLPAGLPLLLAGIGLLGLLKRRNAF